MSQYFVDGQKRLQNLKPQHGRPKGVPNKTGAVVRWGLVEAYRRLGGVDGLVEWGRENRTEFYKLLKCIVPAEIADQHGVGSDNRIQVIIAPAKSTKSNDIKEIDVGKVTGTGDAVSIDHATEQAQSLPRQE